MSTQAPKQTSNIVPYNPKFEGIQKGIEVFGDMTLKQIDFIAKMLAYIPVVRGCYNVCAHCLRHAKPPIRESETHINRMAYEDFKAFCDGFIELNARLGYNIFATHRKFPGYKTLHHDSDGAYLRLKDDDGVEHDFIELANMLYATTGTRPLFDTAGWNPKDKETQERMEKYAKYYGDSSNTRNILRFNFSVNPFQSIYAESVRARKSGDLERAEKNRNSFIDRTVNALLTLTPVLNTKLFAYIPIAIANNTKGAEGFTTNDCFLLYVDVLKKLEEKYLEDLNSEEPKYVTSKEQIKKILDVLYVKLRSIAPIKVGMGRILELYQDNDPIVEASRNEKKQLLKRMQNIFVPDTHFFGLLGLNGKFYVGTNTTTIATELAFNFRNKDKQVAPIEPDLMDFVLTNDFLELILPT
ncbi:hypothetical protein tpqmel_0343 [Candidatus Gastranaerophilus sp. (ex Termes propinquus)]|nr:hypothetical protein tpqmel_0343 [Candidatus Gastranaerophilus sp. (ex Termes propinquus)]